VDRGGVLGFPVGVFSHLEDRVSQAPPTERLLSTREAAHLLGVSLRTVLRLLDVGEIARVRIGRRVLVDPQSLREYIAARRET
jgi:excisionase family DNA binding protein